MKIVCLLISIFVLSSNAAWTWNSLKDQLMLSYSGLIIVLDKFE